MLKEAEQLLTVITNSLLNTGDNVINMFKGQARKGSISFAKFVSRLLNATS